MKTLNQLIAKARGTEWVLLLGVFLTRATFGQTTVTNIPTLGGTVCSATALNNVGQVVGFSRTAGDAAQHAFAFSDGVLYDLGTLGGTFSVAWGINAAGQIIGDASTASDAQFHAFLFTGGMNVDLGTLGGSASTAVAINGSGQVTGNAQLPGDSGQSAFLYNGGPLIGLGTLGGSFSSALAINNLGQVTGNSATANDAAQHAFVYSGNTMYDLGDLGGAYSAASGINDAGQVVGESETANFDTHAILFSNGALLDLGTLGGTYSTAYAINRSGQVIGDASTTNDAQYHAFLFQNGAMTDLGTLGGDFSTASALNNSGQVVGNSDDASFQNLPFLWQNGVMVDLNSLLSPNSGWRLQSASLINDAGQIVGFGLYNGNFSWYLLTTKAANRPPEANAGTDQTVECPAPVGLDGGKSSDPDHDPLTFEWREGNTVLGRTAALSVQLPLGSHLITLTVTDSGNLSSQATVTVNVVDSTPPSVVCPAPFNSPAGASCQAAVPDFLSGLNASDACTPANQLARSQNPPAGTLVGPGAYSVTLTVSDSSRNVSSCIASFTVSDTTPPVVVCPAAVKVPPTTNCQAAMPDFLARLSASDNCTPANQLARTQTPPAGTLVGAGTHPVTLTVTDAAGNVSSCNTTFTVTDFKAPVVHCPASLTERADQNCQIAVPDLLAALRVSDNCTPTDQLVKTQTPPAGTLVGPGVHPITITVTDASGNVSSCTTVLTVVDKAAPVLVCPAPVTVSANAQCQATVPDFLASLQVSDNCTPSGQLAKTQNPPAGTILGLGQHSVRLTVSDAGGNTAACTVRFTVVDSTAPTIQSVVATPNIISQTNHLMVPVTLAVSVSDNCDSAPVSKIISITSSDPTRSPGDTTAQDWQITGPLSAKVRAELSATGVERIYTIVVRCTDNSGNSSTKDGSVVVRKP